MEKVRTAIIGCGGIAKNYHVPALSKIPEVDLIAAVDIDGEKAREFAVLFKIPEVYTDYRRVVEREDIDALMILTKYPAHREIVLAGAAAGKQMFMQKPFAGNLTEAEEMVNAVKDAGVMLVTSYQHRFCPESTRAKTYLDEGAIGKLQFIRQVHPGPDMMDIGPHGIDLVRYFSGERIVKVSSFSDVYLGAPVKESFSGIEEKDTPSGRISIMNYILENGVLASHHLGIKVAGYVKFATELYGTDGAIFLRHPLCFQSPKDRLSGAKRVAIRSAVLPESKGEWIYEEVDHTDSGAVAHHRKFIDDVLNGTWNSVSLDDGIATLKAIVASHESARTGKTVELQA